MFFKKSLLDEKGQALLIIVLVMVIGVTVALSLATRTIINLRNTNDQAESQKALSAAEAGVEQAIKNFLSSATTDAPVENYNLSGSFPTDGGATVSYDTIASDVKPPALGTPILLNGSSEVKHQDPVYVWLQKYEDKFNTSWSGNLTIYWGNGESNCDPISSTNTIEQYNPTPALEVVVVYGPVGCESSPGACKASPMIMRKAYDPCTAPSQRASNTHFNDPVSIASTTINDSSGKPITLKYRATVDLNSTRTLLVRINPLYKDTLIGVSSNNRAIPSQGKVFTSTGTSSNNSIRKIQVFEGFPEVPAAFFPFTLLMSGN